MGSWLLESYCASNAPVVDNLKKAGAIIIGRTNTLILVRGTTDNVLHGRTLNPWNDWASPGGSSGGASAAVMAVWDFGSWKRHRWFIKNSFDRQVQLPSNLALVVYPYNQVKLRKELSCTINVSTGFNCKRGRTVGLE